MTFVLIVMLSGVSHNVFGQTEGEFDAEYARRIQLDEIDGVYIPEDLEDAFAELERLSTPADIEKFKNAPEDTIRRKLHFGLGQWMILNWGFYEGSRLSHYLKGLGLDYPDDMAQLLIVSFHRHLNDEPLRVGEQVTQFKAFREAEIREREKRKEVILQETRIRKDKQ